MPGEGQVAPLRVEEVHAQVAVGAPRAGELAAGLAAEAHHLVVGEVALPIRGVEVLLGDDAGPHVLVGPLPARPEVVVGQGALDLAARSGDVEGRPVAADGEPARVVGALEHEAIRQRAEVYLVESVPNAQGGDHVLPADALGHPGLHLGLVHELGVKRVAVVELEPLELLVEGLRVVQVEGVANARLEQQLKVTSVLLDGPAHELSADLSEGKARMSEVFLYILAIHRTPYSLQLHS